jgi:hypothetical protein
MTTSSSEPLDPALADHTLAEHRETMQAVVAVENFHNREPDPPERWIAAVVEELARAGAALRAHFAEETLGPLFRQVPLARPRFAGKLERLEAEHGRLLEALAEAQAHGRRLADPQLHELREFNARVQLLVARIRRHEAEENEVALQAFWDETGAGD